MALRNKAFHQLRQLFQQHTARWQHELPDLTKPQYAVMRAIADKPSIEQVALIEAAVSTKATLAEMLARMENRGLVRREHDPADKRRRFVWLTAEGEKILAAAIPIGDSVDEEFLGRLSGEEQELFMQTGAQDDERIGGKFPDATLSRLIQTTNTPTHQPKEKRPASLETGLSDRCLLTRGTALRYSAPAFAGFRANGAGLQPESGEHVHG